MGRFVKVLAGMGIAIIALAPILRADAGAPAPTTNPSTQPSAQADTSGATSIFHDRGLIQMGNFLILPDETRVHQGCRKLRSLRNVLSQEAYAKSKIKSNMQDAQDQLETMRAQYKQICEQEQQLANNRPSAGSTNAYNSWVNQYNAILVQRNALVQQITLQASALDEMRQGKPQSNDAGAAVAALLSKLIPLSQSLDANYASLAQDALLTAAINKANAAAGTKLKLGPSDTYARDEKLISACLKEVPRGLVPVCHTPDGDPVVVAFVNGKPLQMFWDSGASSVTLSWETAKAMGVPVTDDLPTDYATTAEGKHTPVKVTTVDSISIGGYTVKDVRCIVFPQGYRASDLLGDTFQKHFVCRLDQSAGRLELSPADSSVQ